MDGGKTTKETINLDVFTPPPNPTLSIIPRPTVLTFETRARSNLQSRRPIARPATPNSTPYLGFLTPLSPPDLATLNRASAKQLSILTGSHRKAIHGAPKRIRFCPAHPGRGTRYRLQRLTRPTTPFTTSPFSPPSNPTHTGPLTKAAQKSRHLRRHSASLNYTLPGYRRRAHGDIEGTIQRPYPTPRTPDSLPLRIPNSTGHPDQRHAPPPRPRATYGAPTAGTSHP